ncbi:hypothetical protein [Kitasatospora purpeofusca]|uniref:hypothetical protein n=1 Tax=Kitasatospora purpeofusca TaxID=67352 RepID=UPI0038026665
MILPLDAYEAPEGKTVLARAATVLSQECMRAKGLELPPSLMAQNAAAPPPPSVIYGVINLESAKTYGYRQPPQESTGVPADTQGGTDVPPDVVKEFTGDRAQGKIGCSGESRKKLGADTVDSFSVFLQDLKSESRVAASRDSRVKAATAEWSSCMKDAGLEYAKPSDPAHDRSLLGRGLATPEGAALPPPSPAEINAAVTDVGCKARSNYLVTVAVVTAAYQKQIIEKQAQRLQEGQKDWKQLVENANRVLMGT